VALGAIDSLAAIMKAYPEARLIAFADLSSRMILASQTRDEVTQEHLDQLCKQARASFDDPLFGLSVEAFGEPQAAVVMGQSALRVFVRSEADPADALCCVCDPALDLAAFVASLRETLDDFASG
jgi:hypothetical protein